MTKLIIMGAGGHGAVVAEAAVISDAWESVAFLDDDPRLGHDVVGCPILGAVSMLPELLGQESDYEFFAAVGGSKLRIEMLSSIEEQGGVLAKIVHPSAVVSPSVSIEAGSVICAAAVISARASIARGCIVNNGSTIDHDCVLGNAVHVSPGAHLAGDVTIGDNSWIGIGASVREGIKIGRNAIVGAGAAVVSDVPDGVVVTGVPARPMATESAPKQ